MDQILTLPPLQLVLGGARSGKSGHAEQLAHECKLTVTYVATARAWDDEMRERIKHHQAQRPDSWGHIEIETDLANAVKKHSQKDTVLLIDCLTLWMMNLLQDELEINVYVDQFLDALKSAKGSIILVSNEISMGVVPMGKVSRVFVDELGRLHQAIAQQADNVTLMVAGLPLTVK